MINFDDHIDDLFREARDKYPLKTGEGDWDKVQALLQKEIDEITPIVSNTGNKNKWRFFWLLLLLPFGWIIYESSHGNNGSSLFNPVQTGGASFSAHRSDTKLLKTQKMITPRQVENQSGHIRNRIDNTINITTKTKFQSGRVTSDHLQLGDNRIAVNSPAVGALPLNKSVNSPLAPGDNGSRFLPAKKYGALTGTGEDKQADDVIDGPDVNLTGMTIKPHLLLEGAVMTTSHFILPPDVLADEGLHSSKEPLLLTNNTSLQKEKNAAPRIHPTKKGWYVGLLGGPDVSTIKMQQVKGTGYNVGIILGYRFNRRISLETNFSWDKKAYYTDGKNVNKQNFYIPSAVSLLNMDGTCHMYELGFTGKYDFTPYQKNHFFVRGGLVSYFMKKEEYSYLAESSGWQYTKSSSYDNSGNNLFSVLHVSGGYEYQLGKVSVRMEPYFKVPLTGIGKGKLPISSLSMNLGVTVPFH